MDSGNAVAVIVTGVVVGVVSAIITHKTLDNVEKNLTEEALDEACREGYNKGWAAFKNHPGHVRARYQELFEEPDQEAGLTVKPRQKRD